MSFRNLKQQGSQPSQRIEFLGEEKVDGCLDAVYSNQFGLLQVSRKKKIVGTLLRHDDPNSLPINFCESCQRRAGGNEIRGIHFKVRSSESDFRGAIRISRKERDIPRAAAGSIGQAAGGLVAQHL